jgi:hypothetical protein
MNAHFVSTASYLYYTKMLHLRSLAPCQHCFCKMVKVVSDCKSVKCEEIRVLGNAHTLPSLPDANLHSTSRRYTFSALQLACRTALQELSECVDL